MFIHFPFGGEREPGIISPLDFTTKFQVKAGGFTLHLAGMISAVRSTTGPSKPDARSDESFFT
jgi:hypothetical protein